MITRVRIEATGAVADEVRSELVEAVALVQCEYGGEWKEEDPGVHVIEAATGFWGRLTIRYDPTPKASA